MRHGHRPVGGDGAGGHQEIDRLGLENAEVLEMDAEDLRFPDASFDRVLCGFAIFFFPRLDRALLRCAAF